MSQFKTGQAKVLSATPNKVVLTGAVTTGNIAVGNLWKFQGESPAWFTVASIVDSVSFTLSANYSGAKAFDTFFDYVVTKDFTPNVALPELAAGDVDIRDVYTRAMRDVDALIGGHKKVTGYTELIQADVDGNIALGVRGKSLTQTADIFTVEKSDATKLLRVLPGGGLVVSGVGPHAIGGATAAQSRLRLTGTFAPAGGQTLAVLDLDGTITGTAGDSVLGVLVHPTITEAASGIHARLAFLDIAGTIINGVATATDVVGINIRTLAVGAGTTNASGLKIDGATGATNNYALWVAAGASRFDGLLLLSSVSTPTVGPSIFGSALFLEFNAGTTGFTWNANDSASERMRLTAAGNLSLGTTFVSGAVSAFIQPNAAGHHFVNGAGTATVLALSLNAANNIRMDFATQTTIGANGAASALTANPVGYIIIDIAGTERIIPFYTK